MLMLVAQSSHVSPTPVERAGIDVGSLVEQALRICGMSHKEAWLICEIDRAHWSRAMSGERPLDLWWLQAMPWRFWVTFIPLFVSALTVQWLADKEIS